MGFSLYVGTCDNAADYSGGKRYRFAVVDLDRAKEYPLNFVCMLPLRIGSHENKPSKFATTFGEKSLTVAKKLLTDALKSEDDPNIKAEIERRLKLLEPKPIPEKVCVSCGTTFKVEPRKRFRQKFCQDCLKKRFPSRK